MAEKFVEIYQDLEPIPWTPVPGRAGIFEKIIHTSPDGRRVTKLIKVAKGVESTGVRTVDCWEEGYLIKGKFTLPAVNQTVQKGMYICRPPGGYHGPSRAESDCLLLMVSYRD